MKIHKSAFFLICILIHASIEAFCPYGYWYNINDCFQCSPGYFCIGETSQNPCGWSSYQPSPGQSTCIACKDGQVTSGVTSTSSSDCACEAGREYTGSGCDRCPPGKYNPSNGLNCLLCPSGTYQSNYGQMACTSCPTNVVTPTGSTSISVCLTCDAGYYPTTICVQCPAGSYSTAGSISCTNCSLGSYAPNTGSTNCTTAPAGSYVSSSGASAYTQCSAGYMNPSTGKTSSSDCTACNAGYFSAVGSSSCQSCQAGYYSTSVSEVCTICNPGFYSATQASICTACIAGTAGTVSGSTTVNDCQQCPLGKYSLAGSSVCTQCSSGSYADNMGMSSCTLCPAGKFNPNTGGSSLSDCGNCDIGNFSTAGSSICTFCSPGSYSDTPGLSQCISCPAGTANPNSGGSSLTSCQACLGGTAAVAGSSSCIVCPAGQYAPARSGSCFNCALGSYSSSSQTTDCTITQAGTFVPTTGSTAYTNCPAGTFNANTGGTSASSCLTCVSGTYSLQGSPACTLCSNGTANSATGSTSSSACVSCSAGYFASSPGLASCNKCPTGTYTTNTGTITCSNCPAGTSNGLTGGTSLSSCVNCVVGYFSSAEGCSSCTQCPVGTYADAAATTQCTLCPVGKANPYTASISSSACVCCLAGNFASAGSSACSPCNPGQYSPSCSETCTNCPIGNYATASGTTTCTVAPTGSYVDTTGASTFIKCPAGYSNGNTMSTSSSACIPCVPGSYAPTEGSSSCTPCALGNIQNLTGQTSCFPCSIGYFQNQTGQIICIPCAVGSFNTITGQSSCILCMAGTKQNKTTQNNCDVCPIGTHQPVAGKTSCINCTMGYYQNYPGQAACYPCKAGMFTPNNASTLCKNCPAGSYQANTGQSACNLCPSGSYSDAEGLSTCKLCSPGTFQDKIGQSTPCKNCSAGSVNPVWGGNNAWSCHQCPLGSYQYFEGKADCVNCSNTYCGPCQFTDRTLCDKLNRICWVDYTNYSVSNPLNTTDCIKAIAPICYEIWNITNLTDPQCLYFTSFFDLTKMKTKVKLLTASLSADGLYLILNFDKPINRNDFTDCSSVFSQDTLNWLPPGKTCKWSNSTTLQVDFSPYQGIPSSITIVSNSFFYDYIYCQESADAGSIDVTLPPPKITVVIAGLTTLSECDNLELLANLASPSLYPLVFSWNITFIAVGKTMNKKAILAANNYFLTYSSFSDLKPVSVPSFYYQKDCIINVTLLAKAANTVSDIVSKTVIVNILGDIPKIKFASKSQAITSLPGDSKSVLAIQIANKRCQKVPSQRRLLPDNGNLIPISTQFQVFSGPTIDIMAKDRLERKIEVILNTMYTKYKILSMDKSQGFIFGKLYKIMATVTNLETGQSNIDTYNFAIVKPSLTSVIDPIGSIVSITSNVILNGGNSSFPDSKGEMIGYKWTCISCVPISDSSTCSCPILKRYSTFLPKLTLQRDNLKDLCTYTFSLSVSSIGYSINGGRTDSSQIEFLTFKAPIRPVIGRIIKGKSNKFKDIYFTFHLRYPGPDSILRYNWTLVEIKSYDPNSKDYYSEKNAYVSNYLNSLGVSGIKQAGQDKPIPNSMKPTYITPTNKRFLGIDKATLISQYQYTFGVVVNYPDYPSFLFVQFTAPKLPRTRILTISPLTGVGFTTPFSIIYLLPQITDIDNARYQIYRKDCPSDKKSPAKSLTQVMGQSNLFTTTLAPGNAKCDYQVEIILRSIEFDDFLEISVIATVTTPPTPASTLISNQLAALAANNDTLTVDQTITTLSTVSSVNQSEPSSETKKSVSTMIQMVGTIDSPQGGAMTLCNQVDQPKVLNTTTEILANIATNQAPTVDLSSAANISTKATNYLSIAKSIDGGTSMVPTIITSLSGVADIGKTEEAKPTFYTLHQQALGNMTEMKLNETQPGSPPYSVSSPAVEMVVQKNYTSAFDSPQNATSDKGSQMNMPGGLQDQLQESIQKSSGTTNGTMTVGTSLTTMSYNPFSNIKENSKINTSSFSNNTSEATSPTLISNIYNDLSKGKLQDVVDNKEQDTNIIQVAFTPSIVQKDSSEEPTGKKLIISSLPEDQRAYFVFPTSADNNTSQNSNDTSIVPLYYDPANKTWTNDGCIIDSPIFSKSINVSCDHIGKPVLKGNKVQVVDTAISIVVDFLKDLLTVMRAGNYAALYNFGAFLTAPATNFIVLALVILFFGLIALITLRLKKVDKKVLYYERIKTLYARYRTKKKEEEEGFVKGVYKFFSSLKLDGTKATFRSLQKPIQDLAVTSKRGDKTKQTGKNGKDSEEKNFISNGFNQLSWMEEKELKDLYYYYHESSCMFSDTELYTILYDSILENKVLKRLTQARLEDIILDNPSFCTILKSEHPYVNSVAQPDLKTPRPIKTLILASIILGQLFITGYFFNSQDTISISEEGQQFASSSATIATCCSLMMIPLRIIISVFLGGKTLTNHVLKGEIEDFEKNEKCYQYVGALLLCVWAGACLYGITMFVITFTTTALLKWILTYLAGIFINVVVIFTLKLSLTIIIAQLLLKLAKCKSMLVIAGSCAGSIIDFFIRYLT